MEQLTAGEIRRLSVLKTARELGIWPAPVTLSFAERHGITLDLEQETQTAADRIVYKCRLRRMASGAELVVRFQILPVYPEPPTADEVLRWLAMSAAHLRHTQSLGLWEGFHYLTTEADGGLHPYRGLVRPRSQTASFADTLVAEAHRSFAFLGKEVFDELLALVDADVS